jgi:plasmid stabilization system protein ParE
MLGIVDELVASLGVEAALAVDDRLDEAIESLAELSNRGRVVPELRAHGTTTYRELVVTPYYRIVYRVEEREVWIIAVLDHRRDLDRLLRDRARRDRAQ